MRASSPTAPSQPQHPGLSGHRVVFTEDARYARRRDLCTQGIDPPPDASAEQEERDEPRDDEEPEYQHDHPWCLSPLTWYDGPADVIVCRAAPASSCEAEGVS
ncbi:hypothetical protein GCM10010328_30320 [Streptomyces rubiginosohelvolus]|uniref:Uncharacterized protein n=1 Tax=Streptomyces rubiginosohelvolus TaxID=67362 RepID=A0ABQ3BPU1_9ACTN|nr:hypothetical protein GCM10010328_30320 [Streptomyces pluricolorescens]